MCGLRVRSLAKFAAALTVALAAILAVTARPAAAHTNPFRASFTITGGTGRFDGAESAGEVSLAAQLMQVIGSEGSGTFSPLSFAGTITT